MGDYAAAILYSPSRLEQKAVEELQEVFRTINLEYMYVGLLILASKGNYPGFLLDDLCLLTHPLPNGTVVLSVNDSGEQHRYVYTDGGWTSELATKFVPEELVAENRTLKFTNESYRAQIKSLSTELAVLKGK